MPTFQQMREKLPILKTEAEFEAWFNELNKLRDCSEKEDLQIEYLAQQEAVLQPSADTAEAKQRQVGNLSLLAGVVGDNFKGEVLQQAFQHLAKDYPGFRQVRGDGNCYFRAVIYGLIEQAIASPERAKLFDKIAQKTEALKGFDNTLYDQELTDVTALLRQAARGEIWPTLQALETDMRDINSESDALLVRAARVLTVVNAEADPELNDTRLETDHNEILTMGREADGSFIQKGNLFNALGISGSLVRVETKNEEVAKREGIQKPLPQGTVEIHQLNSGSNPLDPRIEVNILLRPGHYDLFYSEKQFNTMIEFQKSGRPVAAEAPQAARSEFAVKESVAAKADAAAAAAVEEHKEQGISAAGEAAAIQATKKLYKTLVLKMNHPRQDNKPAKEEYGNARDAFLEGAAKYPEHEYAILKDAAGKMAKMHQMQGKSEGHILGELQNFSAALKEKASEKVAAVEEKNDAVDATRAFKAGIAEYKAQELMPHEAAMSLLEELTENIVHHQDKIEASMQALLGAIPEEPEEKLGFLTKAVDILNTRQEFLVVEGYSENSPVFKRIEAQSERLQNEILQVLEQPSQGNFPT